MHCITCFQTRFNAIRPSDRLPIGEAIHRQPEIFRQQNRHDVMLNENRIGQSAWDYGTVKIIMIATLAVSFGNARVYGGELLSAPVDGTGGTILDRPH